MLMYPAWVLREMKRICEASDVLFIADEVMTAWGRTGTLFACYSKGLTGGALPLAVTLCGADIFDAHCSKDCTRTFFHSSSDTALARVLILLRFFNDRNLLLRPLGNTIYVMPPLLADLGSNLPRDWGYCRCAGLKARFERVANGSPARGGTGVVSKCPLEISDAG